MAVLLALPGCSTLSPTGSVMRDGDAAMAPQGWVGFCMRNRGDPSCVVGQLDAAAWRQLRAAAAALAALPRREDEDRFGQADYWQAADARGGDCEDLALAARARLLADGWPPPALRLTTAWTEQGLYHIVLSVDVIDRGRLETLVIDSRFPGVQTWDRLRAIGYRFDTRQAAHGPAWVKIAAPGARPSKAAGYEVTLSGISDGLPSGR